MDPLNVKKTCIFHRESNHPSLGRGIGYCDLGLVWAICDGDIKFCEEPEAFIRNLYSLWQKQKRTDMNVKVQTI